MSFEWRTDEDDGWQEGPKREKTAVPQSFLRRRWRFLLVALLGIAAVWFVVQWQINQRVATATVEVESELLNTHNFVLRTAVEQDEDLFKSNLSGRDPEWGEMQKTLLNEGLLLNRPMLGWQHVPAPDPLTEEDVTITLDPTFNAAELLYPQTYAVQIPSGETEMVTLQQTAVYRLGERRWLYSPPLDDFWGDWITQGGDYLTVAYPARDREVAARLAIHLDQLVGQMCAELVDLNCDDDLRFHLRLDTDPESLLELNKIETMLTTGLRLELPAPTLVGLPTDDAGYEVLYQAYGVQLATAVIAHQIEYDCCRHQLFFRALRDHQLAQLDLQAWPLTEEMYSQALTNGFDGDVTRHWTRRWEEAPPQFLQVWVVKDPDPIWQQVYMLIEFLTAQEATVSPTEMMRLMDRNSFHGWARDVLSGNYYQNVFATQFLEYIYAQTSAGQLAEPPIPLPKGSITLVCENYANNGPESQVFTFDLSTGDWTERFAGQFTDVYVTTTDGEHFVVSEYGYDVPDNTYKFSLVTEDSVQLLEEAEIEAQAEHGINYFLIDKVAGYLMRYEYEFRDGQTYPVSMSLRQLDCASDNCPEIPLDGWPIFSPDRRLLLVRVAPELTASAESAVSAEPQNEFYVLSLDGQLRQSVGQGDVGFWLTEDTYGLATMGSNGWELVTAVLPHNQPRFLLNEADLLAEIPAEERPDNLIINQVMVNPTNAQETLLHAREGVTSGSFGPDDPSYLFKLTLTADLASVDEIELLRMDSFSGVVGFSPDGRFIIVGNYGYSGPSVTWYLLDQETGQTSEPIITQGYNLSWSPDGQWFIQDTDNYLLLTAPAYEYQHFIPHGFDSCPQVILSVDE
ncbi:MAG: hypothetical protein CL608_31665 [Anaerolineaceae bacterium]|nr:hypothetical protein [Anaerolineaceae bacterium]